MVPLYAKIISLVFNLISGLGVKNMYLIENSLTESSTVSILSNNPYALYHNLKFSHAVAFAYASAGSYLEDRLQEFCNKVCNKVCSKVCNMVCNKLIQHHMQ